MLVDDDLEIRRQSAARLGRLCVVMNAEKTLFERVPDSGNFDAVAPLGLAAPNAEPTLATNGAGNVNGTRAYMVTFYDSINDHESNPAEETAPVAFPATNNKIRVTFADTNWWDNERYTHRRVYRNDADNGSTFYRIATVPINEPFYDDDDTDATIRNADTVELDNDVPETGEYDFCFAHKNYIFLLGDQFFIFSKPGNASAFPFRNKTPIERGGQGRIRLATPIGDILVFYKDGAVYELHYDSMPHGLSGDGFGKIMSLERGCVNESCVANVRGVQYVMDRWGIYQSRGGMEEQYISLPLAGLWPRINWAQRDKFWAAHDDQAAYFAVALDGDTECRHCFVLNLNSLRAGSIPRWHLHRYEFGMRHGIRARLGGEAGGNEESLGQAWRTVVAFLTEFGQVGILATGWRDLVEPWLNAEGMVTAAADTTHFEDDTKVFSRTVLGKTASVLGAYVKFDPPDGAILTGAYDIAYRIVGVSGDVVEFTPALPSAVAIGTRYVIGGWDAHTRSALMEFGDPLGVKSSPGVILEHNAPAIARTIDYTVELDRRGRRMPVRNVDESDHEHDAYDPRVREIIGGTPAECRLGTSRLGFPSIGFHSAQIVLGVRGVDNAVRFEAQTVEIHDPHG
jgi:hypothetical protein